jgi:hypothetical protein
MPTTDSLARRQRRTNARTTFRNAFVALGGGLLIAAMVAWNDNQHRDALEAVALPTGLGVEEFVPLPRPLEFNTELGKFGGLPIYPASLSIRRIQETELEVLVSGLPGEPPVFRRHFAGQDKAPPDGQREYFLKVGRGEYLRVHQGPDRAPFAAGKVGAVVQPPREDGA